MFYRRHPFCAGALMLVAAQLGALALAGCNKGDDQQAAAEKQREAEQKAERAQLEANEKIAEAKGEAERLANEAARSRSDTRVQLQKEIDAVDRKISYLRERSTTVPAAAKKNADVARGEVETRRATLKTNFRKLETESGAAWDAAKAEVEANISAVKAAVDNWETSANAKAGK
jgi:hypothetical protein